MSTYESELDMVLDPLARWTLHSWDGNAPTLRIIETDIASVQSDSRDSLCIIDQGRDVDEQPDLATTGVENSETAFIRSDHVAETHGGR